MASFAEDNEIPRVKLGKDDVGAKLELMRLHLNRQTAIGWLSSFSSSGVAYERQTSTGAVQWFFTKDDRRVSVYYLSHPNGWMKY